MAPATDKPVERWFEQYMIGVGLADAPPDQRREMRRAFFAGVWSMCSLCEHVGEPHVSEEAGMAVMGIVLAECQAFKDAVLAGKE